jgi:beta-N-acetylhexosaminidase
MDTPRDPSAIDAMPTQPMPAPASPNRNARWVANASRRAKRAAQRTLLASGRALRVQIERVGGGNATGSRAWLIRGMLVLNALLLTVAALVPAVYGLSRIAPLGRTSDQRSATGPQQTATPSGTPDPHTTGWTGTLHAAAATAYVNDLIARMPLDEEVGQMLVADFIGTDVNSELAAKIQQYHIGGIILYNRNYYSANSLRTLDQHIQADAKIPLFIAVDQEGGTVDRMSIIDGSRPSAEWLGNHNDPAYVRQIGAEDGQSMYSLGVNVNLAPVVDVQNVPDSQTYMAWRMFGWTPDKVTTMAGAYLDGLQSQHVIGTLKHFPGLGSIGGDPHDFRVTLNRSLGDLDRIDWAPYRALLSTGNVGMIMTTHVTVSAVDPSRPTTVSYPVTTGILRNKLGFQGVIITDDIYMNSLMSWSYSLADRVIGAVQAGDDLIASVFTMDATIRAAQILRDAVSNGTISKARIDESVRRILLLKLQYGMLKMPAAS